MTAAQAESTVQEALTVIMGVIQPLQATDTGKFMTQPETAEAIKAILLTEKAVKQAKEIMVERFKKEALEYDPNFKGIQGDGVRASYKPTGAGFVPTKEAVAILDNALLQSGMPNYLKVGLAVDSDKLEAWQKENGGKSVLPQEIEPVKDRKMSLSFSLVNGAGGESE